MFNDSSAEETDRSSDLTRVFNIFTAEFGSKSQKISRSESDGVYISSLIV